MIKQKVILLANTDWYLYNFRLPLANKLRDNGYEVILVSPEGKYGAKLQELGFRWHVMPMNRRSVNPWREASLVLWLARFFQREKPALVHGFTIKGAVYGSLAGKLAGVPIRINAVDGMGYVFTSQDLRARLLRPLVRLVMRSAFNGRRTAIILQNSDDIALFKQAGLADERSIRLIKGAGVNCLRYIPRPPADAGQRAPLRILLAARLIWEKGIAEYVEAARRLKGESRSVKFFLAGAPDEGNPAAVDKALIEGWVREGLVDWLGHVSDMPGLLSTMDVVVLPSYYREGLPTTLIEGAACALPLITTDAPGCREVVSRNGDDGILIPARDSSALADAIRLLDDDRALGIKLGLAARKKVLSEFDENIVLGKTLAVYRELGAQAN
ncbi:glycosyltransferase family 4 protein [Caballeronia telluris]|uniref:Glycosyl transferase n=1 Tax=Caballeronia telluris TaxID=326475 RepID=A0A158GG39_9BURK|nr:glycosyltransferase family 4 protein [Caballeronia telluris]SAL30863.1 glycosyl transferase [Caballeronia telluris]